ncbi:reverse transcriptase domain-containing protein, partial [Tanacetum coccineum]
MVKKHDDSWRMCLYFKDLNKACPKDGYPLPEIDWKVESLCGFPFKCLLHAYKGYHQIQMAKDDEEKIAFITSQGIFCYTKMPFGLRNAGATYQHLVDKAFHKQIGRNLEVFLAKSAEKSLPFFKNLKKCTKNSDFYWTTEAEEAFKQMKQLIAELPMLTALIEKEELIVYLAAAKETVSAVLMTEREAKQMPIYFVSRALRGPEINYTSMEKLVLTLVHANTPMEVEEELPKPWILFTDGPSYIDGFGVELILTNPEGMEFTYALRFRFEATNNIAKYEALIAGLRIAEQMGIKNLQANVDSRLVANQVNRTYVAKETDMIRYLEKGRALTSSFKAEVEVLAVVEEEGDTWMTPIFKYLAEGTLPVDVKKARVVRRTRSIVAKALRTGYYWPTMHKDARTLKRACQDCQVHKPVRRNPHQKLTPITSLWPFYKWGIDIAGPFPEGPGKTNGLVERENRSLGQGIKARLDARSKNWIEELPHVLWAHRTMIKSSNGDTSFSLTYGMEAVIPAKIGLSTLRTAEVDLVQNNEALGINLNLLEERREEAAIREAKSKSKMEKYYNSKVRNSGKLGPKWEGPYEVTKALRNGAYKLRDRDGKQLPRTWNISNLKKCYIHKA